MHTCLKSVLSQTYGDFELIVVNDGSTDNTDQVIHPFLVNNENIRYIKQKHRGQAFAKNNGIINSRGGLVAFLDADDIWESTKLEKQIPLFSDPDVGVVYSSAKTINENGVDLGPELGDHLAPSSYMAPMSGKITNRLIFDNFIPFSSSVVRRDCFRKVGIFDESLRMAIDWDLWLKISLYYNFCHVDEPLISYRIGHAGQMSYDVETRRVDINGIVRKFMRNNPGILSTSLLKKAQAYRNCNYGYYYRKRNLWKSLKHYLLAIKCSPLETKAYRGLIKSFLYSIIDSK